MSLSRFKPLGASVVLAMANTPKALAEPPLFPNAGSYAVGWLVVVLACFGLLVAAIVFAAVRAWLKPTAPQSDSLTSPAEPQSLAGSYVPGRNLAIQVLLPALIVVPFPFLFWAIGETFWAIALVAVGLPAILLAAAVRVMMGVGG